MNDVIIWLEDMEEITNGSFEVVHFDYETHYRVYIKNGLKKEETVDKATQRVTRTRIADLQNNLNIFFENDNRIYSKPSTIWRK